MHSKLKPDGLKKLHAADDETKGVEICNVRPIVTPDRQSRISFSKTVSYGVGIPGFIWTPPPNKT